MVYSGMGMLYTLGIIVCILCGIGLAILQIFKKSWQRISALVKDLAEILLSTTMAAYGSPITWQVLASLWLPIVFLLVICSLYEVFRFMLLLIRGAAIHIAMGATTPICFLAGDTVMCRTLDVSKSLVRRTKGIQKAICRIYVYAKVRVMSVQNEYRHAGCARLWTRTAPPPSRSKGGS